MLRNKKMRNLADQRQHFSIRKLTIGVASVLLGTSLWFGRNAGIAQAADTNNNKDSDSQNEAQESQTRTPAISNDTHVVVTNRDSKQMKETSDSELSDSVNKDKVQKAGTLGRTDNDNAQNSQGGGEKSF